MVAIAIKAPKYHFYGADDKGWIWDNGFALGCYPDRQEGMRTLIQRIIALEQPSLAEGSPLTVIEVIGPDGIAVVSRGLEISDTGARRAWFVHDETLRDADIVPDDTTAVITTDIAEALWEAVHIADNNIWPPE
ncbi:MAG: hypothetical protein JRD89_00395 [Deltaproteobacteria bacterium]|nr:hypothetical protein [Deltaproteobacteria bacterium]